MNRIASLKVMNYIGVGLQSKTLGTKNLLAFRVFTLGLPLV